MEIIGKAIGGVLGLAAILFASAALSAWPLMVALGVVHDAITARCPALGFWETLILVWASGSLLATIRGQKGMYQREKRRP